MIPEEIVEAGQPHAGPAGSTSADGILLQAQQLAAQLQTALETRALVDRAVGVMMGRSGESEREAMDRLLALSRVDQQTVAAIARRILASGVGPDSSETSGHPGD